MHLQNAFGGSFSFNGLSTAMHATEKYGLQRRKALKRKRKINVEENTLMKRR
jgi:hypothetical protein